MTGMASDTQFHRDRYNGSRFYNGILLLFSAGFLVGVALICIGQEAVIGRSSLLSAVSLERLGRLDVNRTRLFLYCLRVRLWPAVFLILLSASGLGRSVVSLFLVWSGFSAGVLLSVLSMRYGILGILLFAAGLFPQVFLLVPAYLFLMKICVRMTGKEGLHPGSASGKRGRLSGNIWKWLIAVFMITAGCLAEGFLNPPLFRMILRLF